MAGILCFSGTVALATESSVTKSTEISTFGIKLGQDIKDLHVLTVDIVGEKYTIEPSNPIEFFEWYEITTTPDAKVYKVSAMGDIKNSDYSCREAAAFLSQEFEKTYDTKVFKRLSSRTGEYIYMSDDVTVSIMCMGRSLNYMFNYRKELSSYPVPIDKFKKFNIKI